jgi:hypothetical protein
MVASLPGVCIVKVATLSELIGVYGCKFFPLSTVQCVVCLVFVVSHVRMQATGCSGSKHRFAILICIRNRSKVRFNLLFV